MYRLLERSPASPENSRRPTRATAKEAALKRDEPVGKVCKQARWKTIGRAKAGGASDQRRTAKRHSLQSGVLCVWVEYWTQF